MQITDKVYKHYTNRWKRKGAAKLYGFCTSLFQDYRREWCSHL